MDLVLIANNDERALKPNQTKPKSYTSQQIICI